jgi:hypothetical protein
LFPAGPVSWDVSNFRPRPRRTVVKNLSIMLPVLPVRRIRRERVLPIGAPPLPALKVLLHGLPARKAPHRVRPDQAGLVARAAPDAQVVFPVPVVRAAPVDLAVVLVVHPVRVVPVVRPVVLAVPPARA